MIKANELRIGNYVGILETAQHSDGCNHLEAIFTIDEIRITKVQFKGFFYSEEFADLKPIQITEEWLLRFGFDKDIDDIVLEEKTFIFVSYNDDEFVHIKTNGLETIASVKYVHQLQNIYYALTGKELKIIE